MSDVVGIDVGGTKIAAARLRGSELGESHVVPTDLSGAARIIEQLVEAVEQCRGPELDGVGLGVPSIVDFKGGRVVSSANIPLADVALRDVLGQRLGVPVFVDNDATVAALAEAHDEELTMISRDLVMLTVGTGIGGGLVLGGRIYRGASGGAGEIGHTIVGMDLDTDVPAAGPFPQPSSLEGAASGHALDRLAQECARAQPDSALGRRIGAGERVSGADVVDAAQDGDPAARAVVDRWGARVGIGVANAINTFDPDEVVIGGGAARAGELLMEAARRTAAAYVLPGLGRRTTIRLARHGVQAGVLGAALLAVHELHDAMPPSPTERGGPARPSDPAGATS